MFHIKITDLKTGEVEIDANTSCIIAVFESGKGQCDGFQLTDCPAKRGIKKCVLGKCPL